MPSIDQKVVRSFGEEWTRFSHDEPESLRDLGTAVQDYFHIFPWEELPPNPVGADVGCGSGRWGRFIAPRVGRLISIDGSEAALEVARRNLAAWSNCDFRVAQIESLPLEENSLDFAYCLGVLHHVSDTVGALHEIVKKLRSGGPFLVYMYYRLENRPAWYRALWQLTRIPRFFIARTPFALRNALCTAIAAMAYWPLARVAATAERVGLKVDSWPLTYYRSKRFYFMRCDALDRFGTLVEKRFTRDEIEAMLREAGLDRIEFSPRPPFWTAVGRKK